MTTQLSTPNFFVIGASKTGTTSLSEVLGSHPDVFVSDPKEPHYFSVAESDGLTADWYSSLFADAAACTAIGDFSTSYAVVSLYPGVEKRLADFSPNGRVIYIVRHPLERIESQWIQLREIGKAPSSFLHSVRSIPEMVEGNLYWRNIDAYRRCFPDDRILLLFFEDFKADPLATARRCLEFLGVDPEVELDDPARRRNVRDVKRSDNIILTRLRETPAFGRLNAAMPSGSVKSRVKRLLTKPIPSRPSWDRETFEWIVAQLSDDAHLLLDHYGRPGLWNLDPSWLEERQQRPSSPSTEAP